MIRPIRARFNCSFQSVFVVLCRMGGSYSSSRLRLSVALVAVAVIYKLVISRKRSSILSFNGTKPKTSTVIGKVSKLTIYPVKVS